MSQLSDIYSVPLSDSGELDDSSYLFSESIAPEHSISQLTPLPPLFLFSYLSSALQIQRKPTLYAKI
jgi:hypothetical protein